MTVRPLFDTAHLPPLEADQVLVWVLDLDRSVDQLAVLESLLSVDERSRAERFRFERDRRRYVASQSHLRLLLGHYLDRQPGNIQFGTRAREKPILAPREGDPDLRFNLAHSGEKAAYVMALGHEVGIDIEALDPAEGLSDLARRFFAPEEIDALGRLSGEDFVTGFYNCWTRKEALLKATGEGLYTALDQFVVSLNPGEAVQVLAATRELSVLATFQLEALDAGLGYVAAVAFERGAKLMSGSVDTHGIPNIQ